MQQFHHQQENIYKKVLRAQLKLRYFQEIEQKLLIMGLIATRREMCVFIAQVRGWGSANQSIL